MKLKGIDGGPHKRWSMWFNSKQRAEPYQGLTWECFSERSLFRSNTTFYTGAAWLSSARVVRCWVKSRNERNPRLLLLPVRGLSEGTAGDNPEEGVDDVKSSWPLHPGLHTCYNGRYKERRARKSQRISKSRSQFGLWAATRPHEVGVASNRGSACRGEYVPGPCTHRPSHHGS